MKSTTWLWKSTSRGQPWAAAPTLIIWPAGECQRLRRWIGRLLKDPDSSPQAASKLESSTYVRLKQRTCSSLLMISFKASKNHQTFYSIADTQNRAKEAEHNPKLESTRLLKTLKVSSLKWAELKLPKALEFQTWKRSRRWTSPT